MSIPLQHRLIVSSAEKVKEPKYSVEFRPNLLVLFIESCFWNIWNASKRQLFVRLTDVKSTDVRVENSSIICWYSLHPERKINRLILFISIIQNNDFLLNLMKIFILRSTDSTNGGPHQTRCFRIKCQKLSSRCPLFQWTNLGGAEEICPLNSQVWFLQNFRWLADINTLQWRWVVVANWYVYDSIDSKCLGSQEKYRDTLNE